MIAFITIVSAVILESVAHLGDKTWDDRLEAKVDNWLLLGIKVIAFLAIMLVFITQG